MKKLIPLLLLITILTACTPKSQLCIDTTCYNIQIADEPHEHQKGLMKVKNLPSDEGMLFIFSTEQPYSFWMKNTLIPLDMIWINKDGTIIDIQKANPCKEDPCPSYTPKQPALFVLELNQNSSHQIGQNISLIMPNKK